MSSDTRYLTSDDVCHQVEMEIQLGLIILYDKFVNVNIFRWVQERMGWVIIN